MATLYDHLDDKLIAWIEQQHVYFVGTAPLSAYGHVNVSPKGMAGTFAVLGPRQVAYLDYHGSGAETIAHLREEGNARITIMFCAFERRPVILRLYGRGRAVLVDDPEFPELRALFPKERTVAQRAVIVVDLDRIADSCGKGVPFLDFVADRDVLDLHQEKRGPDWYATYAEGANARSIDGLPALTRQE